jgi:SSS family solute:Na+ symporter
MIPIIIAIVYFGFFSIFFGIRAKRKISNGKDFFTASGQLGWIAVMCSFTLAPLGGGHTSALWQAQAGMGMGAAWWGITSGGFMTQFSCCGSCPMFRKLKVRRFRRRLERYSGRTP